MAVCVCVYENERDLHQVSKLMTSARFLYFLDFKTRILILNMSYQIINSRKIYLNNPTFY